MLFETLILIEFCLIFDNFGRGDGEKHFFPEFGGTRGGTLGRHGWWESVCPDFGGHEGARWRGTLFA